MPDAAATEAAGGEKWQTSAPPAVRVEQTERDMEREHPGGTADMLASPSPGHSVRTLGV